MIWTHQLRLGDFYQEENVNVKTLGKVVARRLRKLNLSEEFCDQQEKIARHFERCEDEEEFDRVMEDLYDLGDFPVDVGSKLIWVDTFSSSLV